MVDAFQNMAECMLNYMTDINLIQIDPSETVQITVTGQHPSQPHIPSLPSLHSPEHASLTSCAGHDMESLLYNYMNELLFRFVTDSFCAVKVTISELNREAFSLTAQL